MFFEFLEELRNKSEEERTAITYMSASAITSVVALLWLSSFFIVTPSEREAALAKQQEREQSAASFQALREQSQKELQRTLDQLDEMRAGMNTIQQAEASDILGTYNMNTGSEESYQMYGKNNTSAGTYENTSNRTNGLEDANERMVPPPPPSFETP